ncbi:MAG: AAA family ATPase [Blastopirellula sp.]|nr:MAG: AAA family ATPase [Blastopirellula sp.]
MAIVSDQKQEEINSRIDPATSSSAEAMPEMVQLEEDLVPKAPGDMDDLGVDFSVLCNLALKLASTVPQFRTDWAATELRLPLQIVEKIYWQLKQDKLVEILGQDGVFLYRYSTTERGREFAKRLLEISGYVGPAPVSLEAYTAMIGWQVERQPEIDLESVQEALSHLVIPESSVRVAALAASSGRSLFLFGPAGNGKTTMGQSLHKVMKGELWIPYCLSIENMIIRIHDPQCHILYNDTEPKGNYDRRWIRIHRPLIIAGGEMTMEELDLVFNPGQRFYESPPHVKANGGTFLIDDFGRQRMEPHELLNRWIVPLERRVDFLSLNTGQKIEIPFELMLVVATNLTVEEVADPAFLRRMGYRLHLDLPTAEQYREIFDRCAKAAGVEVPSDLVPWMVSRYESEGRDLRASEPNELIQRAKDICKICCWDFQLTQHIMELAWEGYFGNPTLSK